MAKKQVEPQIKTGKQCKAAINEIKRITDWSLLTISKEGQMNYETLRKVFMGHTVRPGVYVMSQIEALLMRVRSMDS